MINKKSALSAAVLSIVIILSSFIPIIQASAASELYVHETDPNYTAFYNDFENISGSTYGGVFQIADSGDTHYGKAMKITSTGWGTPEFFSMNTGTYSWNGKTHTVFNETIEKDADYILSFDVKSDTSMPAPYAFSFSPNYNGSFWNGDDSRYNVPYFSDGEWHTIKYQFTNTKMEGQSEAIADKLQMKLNLCDTGAISYLDNIYLVKAAKINLIDSSKTAAIADAGSTVITGDNAFTDGIWTPMGQEVKFKVTTVDNFPVTKIEMGGTLYTADDSGCITIPKVTADINITIGDSVPEPEYTVFHNDFENISGSNYGGVFQIVDSGDSDYGKAMKIASNGWGTPEFFSMNTGTYSYNGKTQTVFNETIEKDADYILSFDVKSDTSKSAAYAFSFSPNYNSAFWNGEDYRYNVPYFPDGEWHTIKYQFTNTKTAGEANAIADKLQMKLNLCDTGAVTYLDNIRLVKAAKINLTDASETAVIEDVGSTVITGSDAFSGGRWTPMGQEVKLKVTTDGTFSVTQVKMGTALYTADENGYITIPKVTADISITVGDKDAEPEYTVFYNDFENISGSNFGGVFQITETGDSAYGKAMKITSTGWGSPSFLGMNTGTFSWNGKTHTVFNETVEEDSEYILYFDVKSDTSKPANYAFSFCPDYNEAFWNGEDYRYNVPYFPDGEWHTIKYQFTNTKKSGEAYAIANKLQMKLNLCDTGAITYLDNIRLVKAAKINLTDASGTAFIEDAGSTIITGKEAFTDGIWTPMGEEVKLNVITDEISTVNQVEMGGAFYQTDEEGCITIPMVTADININVSGNRSIIENKLENSFRIDGTDLYLPYTSSIAYISDKTDIPHKIIECTDNAENKIGYDEIIPKSGKIKFNLGGSQMAEYNIKSVGDINMDNEITQDDIADLVDGCYGAEIDEKIADTDFNDQLSVSDAILLRDTKLSLDENNNIIPSTEIASKMDDYVNEVISKSGLTGANAITYNDINNGIYSSGSRALIANVMKKAMRGENITICTFGGSITAGGNAWDGAGSIPSTFGDTYDYSTLVKNWWEEMFSDYGCKVTLVNAGIGATDSPLATHRIYEDVLAFNPDLVITEWAMNDGIEFDYKQGTYESVVRKLLDSGIATILYGFTGYDPLGGSQDLHKPIAEYYGVPFISYSDAYGSNPKFTSFTNDNTHPNTVGHHLAALLLNNYFADIYKNIDKIHGYELSLPTETYHEDGDKYNGAYIAYFDKILNGEQEGVRITDMGAFTLDSNVTEFSSTRKYRGVTATASSGNAPMIIEIDKCKTAFIQLFRSGDNSYSGSDFTVTVNGTEISSNTFTCKHGSDNQQIETSYHWATERICYYEEGEKVILKITPKITNSSAKIQLFALLLSK